MIAQNFSIFQRKLHLLSPRIHLRVSERFVVSQMDLEKKAIKTITFILSMEWLNLNTQCDLEWKMQIRNRWERRSEIRTFPKLFYARFASPVTRSTRGNKLNFVSQQLDNFPTFGFSTWPHRGWRHRLIRSNQHPRVNKECKSVIRCQKCFVVVVVGLLLARPPPSPHLHPRQNFPFELSSCFVIIFYATCLSTWHIKRHSHLFQMS